MKSIFGIALLIFVGIVGWRIGASLSSDALGMAVGILFGIMAGIPTTLILLASAACRGSAQPCSPPSGAPQSAGIVSSQYSWVRQVPVE